MKNQFSPYRRKTDRSKIRSDQKRFFIALSLYPFSFFANTPFNSYRFYYKSLTLQLIQSAASTANPVYSINSWSSLQHQQLIQSTASTVDPVYRINSWASLQHQQFIQSTASTAEPVYSINSWASLQHQQLIQSTASASIQSTASTVDPV